MKKVLGFTLVVLALLTSCSDDDELPNDELIIESNEITIEEEINNNESINEGNDLPNDESTTEDDQDGNELPNNETTANDEDELPNEELIVYEEGNIIITLINITDNRCPTNVNCFVQGNAIVDLRIFNGNETMDFTLNTAGEINSGYSFPTNATVFDLNIELEDLQPLPLDDNTEIPLEDYTIRLSVN